MLLLCSFIPTDDAAWPKYVFNISATSVSSTIFFLFPSIKLILFLDMPLSVRNSLIVPQNFFVSVMTFVDIVIIVFPFFFIQSIVVIFLFFKNIPISQWP